MVRARRCLAPRSLQHPLFISAGRPAGSDCFLLESIFRNEVWEHMQLPVSEENERSCYQVRLLRASSEFGWCV